MMTSFNTSTEVNNIHSSMSPHTVTFSSHTARRAGVSPDKRAGVNSRETTHETPINGNNDAVRLVKNVSRREDFTNAEQQLTTEHYDSAQRLANNSRTSK